MVIAHPKESLLQYFYLFSSVLFSKLYSQALIKHCEAKSMPQLRINISAVLAAGHPGQIWYNVDFL